MDEKIKNSTRSEDEANITATVFNYLKGYANADFAQLDGAFSNKAAMFGVVKNSGAEEVGVWPNMKETIERWSANETPPRNLTGEILHMNVVDGRIATVQLKFGDDYYDALTLAKVNGTWKIVAKVFIYQ
ncbi:MAG: nuclear transport factor 2 family protein [Chloroflexota bacterium]